MQSGQLSKDGAAAIGAARASFLQGMRMIASTVSIVTTIGPAGAAGATITAMSSVSVDGGLPSLLVCVNRTTTLCRRLRLNRTFCINILRDHQQPLAEIFSRPVIQSSNEKFSTGSWIDRDMRFRLLSDCLVAFACELRSELQVDSHWIFIGGVSNALQIKPPGLPLIYGQKSYGRFSMGQAV